MILHIPSSGNKHARFDVTSKSHNSTKKAFAFIEFEGNLREGLRIDSAHARYKMLNVTMNKLLPQFQNVTLWQSLLLAAFSILLTWGLTIYMVNDYIQKTGNEVSKSGNLVKIATATFDATVIVFGLGVYLVAGIACFILLSFLKRFRETPVVQCMWSLFILFGIMAAYVFR